MARPEPAPAGEPLLRAEGVTRRLPGPVPVTLVEGVDLTVGRGEFLAVTGPSGSGKSSLLYLLGLLDRPSAGELYFLGRPTSRMSEHERARLRLDHLGFVFQFHYLLPELSAEQNVALPMRKAGRLTARQIQARARELLARLGLEDCIAKTPDLLSGGQRQRVAVARALANEPDLILADEPTGNLDQKSGSQVFDIFEQLVADRRHSVVTVTHDPALAARAGRQVTVVDGRVVSA